MGSSSDMVLKDHDELRGIASGVAVAGAAALMSEKNRSIPRAAAFMLGGYIVGRYPVVVLIPFGVAELAYHVTLEKLGKG